MSTYFIKLTQDKKTIFINIATIKSIQDFHGAAYINFINGDAYGVDQTINEVQKLIKSFFLTQNTQV